MMLRSLSVAFSGTDLGAIEEKYLRVSYHFMVFMSTLTCEIMEVLPDGNRLVSAFAGKEFVMSAYEEAVRERYRFFSFGDAMLIVYKCASVSVYDIIAALSQMLFNQTLIVF